MRVVTEAMIMTGNVCVSSVVPVSSRLRWNSSSERVNPKRSELRMKWLDHRQRHVPVRLQRVGAEDERGIFQIEVEAVERHEEDDQAERQRPHHVHAERRSSSSSA